MVILGIDPGTGRCGWGAISYENRKPTVISFGVVETEKRRSRAERLRDVYDELSTIFAHTKPDLVAVEELFFAKNQTTAMSVAEARGVVLLLSAQHKIPVEAVSPGTVKMAVSGYGRAGKGQVTKMVKLLLGIKEKFKFDDVADALAVAIAAADRVRG
jgi:crossover junction endodeoxyribonuclease RuvC